MAKGQKRGNREQKKPKQNKVKPAAVGASPFTAEPGRKAGATPSTPRRKH